MNSENEKVEIEYTVENTQEKKRIKEIPLLKFLFIFQFFLPFLLITFLILSNLPNWLLTGFTVQDFLLDLVLPLLLYLVFIIITQLLLRRFTKKTDRALVEHPQKNIIIFTKKGINVNAAISDSVLEWKYIKKAFLTESFLIFKFNLEIHYFTIPKLMLSEEDLRKIYSFLESHSYSLKIDSSLKKYSMKISEKGGTIP